MFNEKELAFFDRHGKQRPEHAEHGEDSWEHPASERLEKMEGSNWRLEGNELKCDTANGVVTQRISPDYIMTGLDDKGLPVLQKIVL